MTRWTVLGLLAAVPLQAGHWPQWRGPGGDAIIAETKLPLEWGTNKNVAWKTELPGAGWSQPIVWGDRILLTTAVTEKQKKPRGGEFDPSLAGGGLSLFSLLSGGASPDVIYTWKVLCLDGATGKVVWEQTAREGKPTIPIHRNNTYASETPVTDGERLIASFGTAGLYCYDLSGKLLWSKNLGSYPMQFGWGTASSPLLQGDRVFVQCDNDQGSFLTALDKRAGDEIWRVTRDEKSNWSTPYLWKNRERTELVAAGGNKMRSYDPATGKLLWEMNGSGRCATTPVGDEQMLYVDSYDRLMGRSGSLVAIRAGAASSISTSGDVATNRFVAWSIAINATRVASPLLYAGCLYNLDQQSGIVRCYDAQTGAVHYKERLPGARGFTASPWANDGKVYCLDETGLTFVLQAGPKLQVLATNALHDTFWSSAAVVGEKLLLRGVDQLYCIGNRP